MGLFRPSTNLGRPKTAQPDPSSLRGRISGPMPMDDEFPIRQPGHGIAHEGKPEPPESRAEDQPASRVENTPPSDVVRADNIDSVTPDGPSQASNSSASPRQQKTARPTTLRYSTVSDGTDVDRPQRKRSTLKSTLGRLFKRKKKSTGGTSISEGRFTGSGEEDASASNRVQKETESKRSVSLPVTDYDRALRSHSIGPDDMMAITSARSSLQVDPALLRRRAASSNRILSGRIKDFDGEIIGLSPRPASTHGRGGNLSRQDDPEDIGRAITSDSRTHRRRSRSLSQLNDTAVGHIRVRKRSDEIRYWRESFNHPILSPNSSTVNNDDPVIVDTDAGTQPETPAEPPEQIPPKTPPQPFNFGPMFGMKITQAASLEDRIATLEVRNQKLEKILSQLFQLVPGVNNYVPDTPDQAQPRGSVAQSATFTAPSCAVVAESSGYHASSQDVEHTSRYSVSQQSNESFGDGNTFIGSLPPSTRPPPVRPTSNSTIRGATSLPALLGENAGALAADQYTTLKALVDTERDARQALEARVTKLSHRLNLICRTSPKLETASTTYSTVSAFEHDDDEPLSAGADTESEAFKTPREEGHFGAFGEELRDEEVDGSRKKAARTLSLSQLTLKRPVRSPPESGVDL
ncbi:uncharacterized protein GGS22DRAFT_14995 [Annulohypoxylon maeteangense]|uniref:uncharacterized protein n=1 Tax=Annulohypoxylon maeteangense TaxID=1927788 RepID=UPI002008DAF4|nr:uncharacterized protein GGS22DRAFT_14995 [Annulohypoxylon maeteangense]KAI0890552.1 hypothetical protein GGS22DRAFT_14995 [Annulohypoxylon maeteangense]